MIDSLKVLQRLPMMKNYAINNYTYSNVLKLIIKQMKESNKFDFVCRMGVLHVRMCKNINVHGKLYGATE